MKRNRRLLWIVPALALAALVWAIFGGGGNEEKTTNQKLKWNTLTAAVKLAQEENKIVLVDVYTDWCSWCKVMEQKTYSDPEIIKYVKTNIIPAKLNPEKAGSHLLGGKTMSSSEVARRFQVRGFPTTVFLTSGGDIIAGISGYIPPDKFLPVLKYVAEGAYQEMKYEDFLKKSEKS